MKVANLRSAVGLSLGILIAGCAGSAGGPDGVYGGDTVTAADNADFGVDTAKAFADISDVVIGGFKVSFITERKGSNKPRGSFLGGNSVARASATGVLQGISQDTLQEITDAAYRNFIARLENQGYRVHPFTTLTANDAFRAVKTRESPLDTDEPLPAMGAKALVFAPSGQKLRLFASQGDGLQGFGWSSPEAGFSKSAEETGIPLLDVHYVVDFVTFGGHSSRSTTSIGLDQEMTTRKGSRLFITSGQGGTFSTTQGSIRLEQGIASTQTFCTLQKRSKSTADKVGSVVATGAAVLLGGGTRSSETYDCQADRKQYLDAALDSLSKANSGLTKTMASLK